MSGLANGALIQREFSAWRSRQKWGVGVSVLDALNSAEDALDDIVHGRIDSTKLSAKEAIALKERGEL